MTILNSKDAFMKKNKQLTIALSAFALTSLILLIVFYVSGVYPFGDRSLLKWDMELQYADFFFTDRPVCFIPFRNLSEIIHLV